MIWHICIFLNSQEDLQYIFWKIWSLVFFWVINIFAYMIYKKLYLNVDLDGTPLPILVVMLTIMGFLFLFMGTHFTIADEYWI